MTKRSIASRIAIRRRYVRSVALARDVDDPGALDGYVVTPSVRDAAVRLLAGLSSESRQRAFRVVGPYGAGKSAFGVFIAQLFRECGHGPATELLADATGGSLRVTAWTPVIVTGRRVSFARELLRVASFDGNDRRGTSSSTVAARAQSMMDRPSALDAHAVTEIVAEMAEEHRTRTGRGLLLLIDEMGRFLEHTATNIETEDPSIFQLLAERSSGRASADLAVVGFMHHRFADYVAGMGGWIEAEWTRSSERYEELSFRASTEQALFMLARAIESNQPHTAAVTRCAQRIYGQAVDRGLFATPREEVVRIAPKLYPLHPAAVAAIALAIRRFGQNERSLFGFLQSLEPDSLKRFAHSANYGAANWYRVPAVFDHLSATISDVPGGDRVRRWSLAFDAMAGAAILSSEHRDVLKVVALLGVLEPLPGLVANADTIAWCQDVDASKIQPHLDELASLNLIYRRPQRGDYGLWSSSSVDLLHWLSEARSRIRAPERLEDVSASLVCSRPAVAHRHYHATGTLRTFEVRLWTGGNVGTRNADGLLLVVPIYPGDGRTTVLRGPATAVANDPLALVCARRVAPQDLKWAHELALWRWVRDNCDELKIDELARAEVAERISTAEAALTHATALLGSASTGRDESWWFAGQPVAIPKEGLSGLLSSLCDQAYHRAPILKNELINRVRLSSAVASARMRLLDRMLTREHDAHLGLDGAPPERTIYRSLLWAPGMHREVSGGGFAFQPPHADDPRNWRPAWDRVAELLETPETTTFARLIEELAAPPYGLRSNPALLLIAAFLLASRDNIAVMERNSFQPELTTAHFMRLAKAPRNFALKSLHESTQQRGLVRAIATGLDTIGTCHSSLSAISERLFTWYNTLPSHALGTASVSPTSARVRDVLRRAPEPAGLFFHDLPAACDALGQDGAVDIERFVATLDTALHELQDATPSLRSRATAAALHAFGARDLDELRAQIKNDYEPHSLHLVDYRLRAFVHRASNTDASPDRWLDGIAGHLIGTRLDNWGDDTLDKFDFEIRLVAGNLAKWLALSRTQRARSRDLRSIHVVGLDGHEQVFVIRRNRPNPHLQTALTAVRQALANEPRAIEVLGQLLAEYSDQYNAPMTEEEVGPR